MSAPRALIAVENIVDTATLSATGALSALPVENLATSHLVEAMRCATADTVISIDAGLAVDFRMCSFHGIFDATGFSATISASMVAPGDDEVLAFNSASPPVGMSWGFDDLFEQALADFGETRTARWFTIECEATGVDALTLGRLFLADALPLDKQLGHPLELKTIPRDDVVDMEGGELLIYRRNALREATFSLGDGVGSSALWRTFQRRFDHGTGLSRQLVLVPVPGDDYLGHEHMILGNARDLGAGVMTAPGKRNKTIRVQSAARPVTTPV